MPEDLVSILGRLRPELRLALTALQMAKHEPCNQFTERWPKAKQVFLGLAAAELTLRCLDAADFAKLSRFTSVPELVEDENIAVTDHPNRGTN